MTLYEMLKDNPKFKTFCRRKLTGKSPTFEEQDKKRCKARKAEFKAFCRPRGMLSILKENEYTTGRRVSLTSYDWRNPYSYMPEEQTAQLVILSGYELDETAKLVKHGDVFESVLDRGGNCEVATADQGTLDLFQFKVNEEERKAA